MEQKYIINESRLCDLLQCEQESYYWREVEENGERYCSKNLIRRELTEEQLKAELGYFKKIEVNQWDRYLEYLKNWVETHSEIGCEGMSPACYDEFCENDDEE